MGVEVQANAPCTHLVHAAARAADAAWSAACAADAAARAADAGKKIDFIAIAQKAMTYS